jgi:hypothetical protein
MQIGALCEKYMADKNLSSDHLNCCLNRIKVWYHFQVFRFGPSHLGARVLGGWVHYERSRARHSHFKVSELPPTKPN